jgi:Tfp pilus assembly protein PilF
MAVTILAGCVTVTRKDMRLVEQGYTYVEHNDYENAEKCFKDALAANPKNPYALLNLGVVYQNSGRCDVAKQYYQQVLDLGGKEVADKSPDSNIRGKPLVEIAKKNLERCSE